VSAGDSLRVIHGNTVPIEHVERIEAQLAEAVGLLRTFATESHHKYSVGHCNRCDAQTFVERIDGAK
jgi:hypothetical protein